MRHWISAEIAKKFSGKDKAYGILEFCVKIVVMDGRSSVNLNCVSHEEDFFLKILFLAGHRNKENTEI